MIALFEDHRKSESASPSPLPTLRLKLLIFPEHSCLFRHSAQRPDQRGPEADRPQEEGMRCCQTPRTPNSDRVVQAKEDVTDLLKQKGWRNRIDLD